MSDRTYTRFSIPMSVLANYAMAESVRTAFGLTTTEFQRIILAQPEPDQAAGHDGIAVRLVDGRPCLVHEDSNCNYGGSHIETAFIAAGVPFIQVNGAGDEYGPTSTVFDGTDSETIRLDHLLAPIVGIGWKGSELIVDPGEVTDVRRYADVRKRVLLWPATAA